jgi:hypothetical protein
VERPSSHVGRSLARDGGNRTRPGERLGVADTPEYLTLAGNRDRNESVELALRRTFFALLALLIAAAALNVFGQRPKDTLAAGSSADIHVFAPTVLRGGLYYEGRLTVEAKSDIRKATFVLDSGWTEQMQINTIEPSPVGEASRDGKLALDYGHLGAGHKLVVYLQFQVNPTNVGRRSQDVGLYDDTSLIATANRTVTVLP